MLDEAEVVKKFRELRCRRLKERQKEFLAPKPRNCSFNRRHQVKGKGQVGFCIQPLVLTKARGHFFVCDADEVARKCACFECKNKPETVEADFNAILREPARVGNEYPKLGLLLWFLQRNVPVRRWARFRDAFVSAWKSFWALVLFIL